MRTDCVLKQGNTAQDCLQHHMAELPEECQHLYKSYVACRRGMVSILFFFFLLRDLRLIFRDVFLA